MSVGVASGLMLSEHPTTRIIHTNIKQQINKLKTPAKEIIIYKYFYDMKNTEIAELLGINASTVGTILSRNIKRIRDMLNEEKFGTKSISEK